LWYAEAFFDISLYFAQFANAACAPIGPRALRSSVVVIGAGPAGCAAGVSLLRNGIGPSSSRKVCVVTLHIR
jgi:NADPH-dependent 2,4-dienoyl-CoA reductase/sulfur reductase-like enzyme